MLYDRPYMRASSSEPFKERTSAVTILLVATIGIYVIQQVLNASFPGNRGHGNTFLTEWFALSAHNFKSLKVWTVFTYAFLHSSNIMHIIGNMLGLFYIGRILEPLLGKQAFLLLYFGGTLAGGLAYLIFHPGGFIPVVGASAAVSAILAFFCLQFPERQITLLLFFIIPLSMRPKWLFWGFLGFTIFSLLLSELPGSSNIAHSAHLGGFLVGILFFRYRNHISSSLTGTFNRPNVELPEWFKRRKSTDSKINYRVNRPSTNSETLQKEVDRILDKINRSGFGSLNETEKAVLERAKELLNR